MISWNKVNYEEYLANPEKAGLLDCMLAKCYEKMYNGPGLGDDILNLIVKIKLNSPPGSSLISMCDQALLTDYVSTSYPQVAEIFGYMVMESPRYKTISDTISAFEHNIACFDTTGNKDYITEYILLCYEQTRRDVIRYSMISETDLKSRVIKKILQLQARIKVLRSLFTISASNPLVRAIQNFIPTDDAFYKFFFLYSNDKTDLAGIVESMWREDTGRREFEWTGEDQIRWKTDNVLGRAKGVLSGQLQVVDSLEHSEIHYLFSLIQSVLATDSYSFLKGEISENDYTRVLDTILQQLESISAFWKVIPAEFDLADAVLYIRQLLSNGAPWGPSKVNDVLSFLGIVVFV